jgi:hypothetical protein
MHVLVCIGLLFAVYLIVAHWTIWVQGSSLSPLLVGYAACLAAWPALGWLALLAFVLDPGSLIYVVLSVRHLRTEA